MDTRTSNGLAQVLSVREAAVELSCSISFVYKLMKLNELAYEMRGRRKFPTRGSVADYRKRNLIDHRPELIETPERARGRGFRHLFK